MKQSAKKTTRKSQRAPKQRKTRHSRLVEFPLARGKTVEKVELSTAADFPCVSIRFQDNTRPNRSDRPMVGLPQRWHVTALNLSAPSKIATALQTRKKTAIP
jgi:hypothetical protein